MPIEPDDTMISGSHAGYRGAISTLRSQQAISSTPGSDDIPPRPLPIEARREMDRLLSLYEGAVATLKSSRLALAQAERQVDFAQEMLKNLEEQAHLVREGLI